MSPTLASCAGENRGPAPALHSHVRDAPRVPVRLRRVPAAWRIPGLARMSHRFPAADADLPEPPLASQSGLASGAAVT